MLETGTMLLFCLMLFASVGMGWSIIPALLAGLVLFLGYGLIRRTPMRRMVRSAAASMRSAGTILVTFVLIGMLTALWRAGGTIAFVIVHVVPSIHGAAILPLSFLLCAGMSALIGSSFASVATMGTICMSIGQAMGTNVAWIGGAILAGVYVGDRCSPVSTSALLVRQLTRTNLFGNIGLMLRTGLAPFTLSCLVYAIAAWSGVGSSEIGSSGVGSSGVGGVDANGLSPGTDGTTVQEVSDTVARFDDAFALHWVALMPALLVVILAVVRVDVRVTMLTSILASIAVCIGLQGMDVRRLIATVTFGYAADDARVAALLNGGGVLSMLSVGAIVCISSAYAGIFAQTGMLRGLQQGIESIGSRIGVYGATLVTSIAAAAVACNQTLAIMLTQQLGAGLYRSASSDGETATGSTPESRQAIDLEDSAVIVPAMIPWSIACAVPLSIIGAPVASIAAACFLYLLPICRLTGSFLHTVQANRRCRYREPSASEQRTM